MFKYRRNDIIGISLIALDSLCSDLAIFFQNFWTGISELGISPKIIKLNINSNKSAKKI